MSYRDYIGVSHSVATFHSISFNAAVALRFKFPQIKPHPWHKAGLQATSFYYPKGPRTQILGD